TGLASGFGILLMLLLWFSAGYPGSDVSLWRYFGASLDWSVFIECSLAFLVGQPEARWSLVLRLSRRGNQAVACTRLSHIRPQIQETEGSQRAFVLGGDINRLNYSRFPDPFEHLG